MSTKAVFLDRDGVIVRDSGFIGTPDQVRLLPNAARAINLLHQRDYLVIVVSNQSGIGRGYFSEADLARVDCEIKRRLARHGAYLDGAYYCPHHPQAVLRRYRQDCSCRKPRPGMIFEAQREHKIDLSLSYMVGDWPRDVEAGVSAGCRSILISKARGRLVSGLAGSMASAGSLLEAVEKHIS